MIEIQVTRGQTTAEELAALTAVLLARAAAGPAGGPAAAREAPGWRPDTFGAPHSWQAAVHDG